jgi:carboxymethylenebutenolidase
MTSRFDTVTAGNGQSFQAYVSLPEVPNGSAVVVLQEIFGVTKTIRRVADRFAAEGYIAIAPDLFWRLQPGIELSYSPDDIAQAYAYVERFDEDAGLDDIDCTVAHLRNDVGIRGGIAVAGLCLGGKLAYRAAARLEIDAGLVFYGVGIEKNLQEAPEIKCPLMMHFGGLDKYASPEAVAQISAAVDGNERVQIHTYADADHGFYTRKDSDAADLAHSRSVEFLKRYLAQT